MNVQKCIPPGSVSTAIDVDVDTGHRWCGMCQTPFIAKLGELCPVCDHRLTYFQLNNTVTAIGGWEDFRRYCKRLGIDKPTGRRESEASLASALQLLRDRECEANCFEDGCFGDMDE